MTMDILKPKRIKQGDTIGIVSPSSGLWQRSELWRSIEQFEKWGYKVKVGDHAYKNNFYLAGTDEERASDLMHFFKDDSVDAIICSQGGYGASRLLNLLDYEVIRKNPKIFMGYSDVTALHLAIYKHSGLMTFHGPSASSAGTEYMTEIREKYMFKALTGTEPIGIIEAKDYLVKINPGIVTAPIIGGNLTLIASTLGTPYEIDTKGKILFFEELDTEPWVIDHMMTHLKNAGKFEDALGFLIGDSSSCEPFKMNPGFPNQMSMEDVIFDILAPYKKPILMGLEIGHTKNLATLPMGILSKLDTVKGAFEILETATV